MTPRLKILLIEDNPGDADLVRAMLPQNDSTDIRWVARLSDALSHLRKNSTDAVLLDLGLPDSDGIDSVISIINAVPDLPIVVLTGNADEKAGMLAVKQGAQDFLFKIELNPVLLLRTVKYAVERKKADLALKDSQTRFKQIFDHTKNGVVVYRGINEGHNFIVVDFNKSAAKIEKISRRDVIGKKVTEVFPGVKDCGLLEVFRKVWSSGNPEHPPIVYYEDQRIAGWRDNYVDKLPCGEIVVIYCDETQRIQAEQKLIESEEQFRTAIDHSNDGVAILKNLHHIYVNQKYLELFGYSQQPAELIGCPISKLLHPDDREKVLDFAVRKEKGEAVPSRYEFKGLHKDGQTVYIEASVAQTSFKENVVIIAFLRDITSRIKAEENRVRIETAIEQAYDGVAITDSEANIQYVNPAFLKLTGYQKNEVMGQNPRIFHSGKHDRNFYDFMWQTLRGGKVWSGQMINAKKDGSLYTEKATIAPVKNADGKITNYVAVKHDMTDDIRRERQLRQAQKMEAIGALAGGIAHDFNNILSAILGYSEITLDRLPRDSPLRDNLEEVFQAGMRAKDLVKQILTFSRQAERQLQPVQVKLIVKEALKLLRASLPATIEVRRPNIRSDHLVLADPTQIHQILMNLCTNAAHAMRYKGGILEVDLIDEQLDAEFAVRYPDIAAGHYQKLSVSDSGHGIPPDILGKIFNPFFTTKPREEGSGMGLSVVHGIVKDSGGGIVVNSKPEKGTVFHVYLPVVESGVKPEVKPTAPLPAGTEHILFVDDEKPLVDLGKEMLEQQGYVVTTRTSSIEALALFKVKADEFDMVVTDMTMPNMNGKDLASEIMQIRPDIPIIVCTGFSREFSAEAARAAGIRAFIHKPIIRTEFISAIRNALDNSAET